MDKFQKLYNATQKEINDAVDKAISELCNNMLTESFADKNDEISAEIIKQCIYKIRESPNDKKRTIDALTLLLPDELLPVDKIFEKIIENMPDVPFTSDKKMYLIVGRAGVGKDTFAKMLAKKGMEVLKSYTTRPKRSDTDDSHIFVDELTAKKLDPQKIAKTVLNGHEYFACSHQFDNSNVYIVDPNGLDVLLKNRPDINFAVIYIKSDDEIAREKAAERFDDKEEGYKVFDQRRADEQEQFDKFDERLENNIQSFGDNLSTVKIVYNDYCEDAFNYDIEQIINDYALNKITQKCIRYGIKSGFITQGKYLDTVHMVYIKDDKENIKNVPVNMAADEFLNDDEGFAALMRNVIIQKYAKGERYFE